MTHPLTDLLPDRFRRKLRTGRDLARAKQRALQDDCLPTACEPLDRLLGGGLARGRLAELVAWGSSGRFAMALGALAATTRGGQAAALIDLGDGLEPHGAAEAGIVLERLLWTRPRCMKEALMATEAVIACGMPLVVLELGVPPVPGGRGGEAFWRRIVREAEKRRSAVLVASPYRVTGTTAHQVVEATERRADWSDTDLDPRLLTGLSSRLRLVRAPGRQGTDRAERLQLAAPSAVATPPPSPQKPSSGKPSPKHPQADNVLLDDPLMAASPRRAIA